MKLFRILFSACFLFSAVYAGEKPLLLQKIKVPPLMGIAEDASKLLEKVHPGSSGMIAVGLTALTLSPELRYFDLTRPVLFYVYAVRGERKKDRFMAFVFFNKEKNIPSILKIGGKKTYTKSSGQRTVVSDSPELLKTLEIPSENEDMAPKTISAVFFPAACMRAFPRDFDFFRRKAASGLIKMYAAGKVNVNELRILQIKLDYLEKVLKQIECLDIRGKILPDRLSVDIELKAVPSSPLDEFVKAQKNFNTGTIPPLYKGKKFSASGAFRINEALSAGLNSMVEDIAVEEAEDDNGLKYLPAMKKILTAFNGRFSSFVDEAKAKPAGFIKFYMNKKARSEIKAELEKSEGKAGENSLYRLYRFNSSKGNYYNVFALIMEGGTAIVNGQFSREQAVELVKGSTASIFNTSGKNISAVISAGRKTPSNALVYFLNDRLNIKIKILPETVKGWIKIPGVLPREDGEKKLPGNKPGGKRIKIRFNPERLFKK